MCRGGKDKINHFKVENAAMLAAKILRVIGSSCDTAIAISKKTYGSLQGWRVFTKAPLVGEAEAPSCL